MVHRPADSRLLTNLLSHEKDYLKHLSHLLEHSQVSLASFSVYASASAPPLSQVIITVAGTLAGADDALRKYAAALEAWQGQLKALKELEDEVGNVMRDREILVTRLIKASKQQKPTRDSILSTSASTSSLSFSKPEVSFGPKLSAAQTELQACEAHLAMKERELEALRTTAIRTGLQARCKAMVECGWTWGEMGKEALRALESIEAPNGHHDPRVLTPPGHKSPPPGQNSDSGHAPSDVSSLAPSQSASQIAVPAGPSTSANVRSPLHNPSPAPVTTPPKPYALQIPSALSIANGSLPNGTSVAQWRISEVTEDETSGSSEDEDPAQFEVHENNRFAKGKGRAKAVTPIPPEPQRAFSIRAPKEPASPNKHVHFPPPSPSTESGSIVGKKKDRHRSGSFFGRLFGKDKDKGGEEPEPLSAARAGPARWQTRTDQYLSKSKRKDDSSDDEAGAHPTWAERSSTWSSSYHLSDGVARPSPASLSVSPSDPTALASSQRLMKKSAKRRSVQVGPAPATDAKQNKGWAGDRAAASDGQPRRSSSIKRKAGTADLSQHQANGDAVGHVRARTESAISKGKDKKLAVSAGSTVPDAKASLSRNSSLSKHSELSVASAPARTTAARPPALTPVPSASSITAQPPTPRGRSNSLSLGTPGPLLLTDPSASTSAGHVKGHKRTASMSVPSTRSGAAHRNDGPSLMSIVEGVAAQNRAARAKADPNSLLVLPRAPPPVDLDAVINEAWIEPTPVVASTVAAPVPVRRSPPRLTHSQMSASASAPSFPVSASLNKAVARLPLRSALRHSRTPSPNPATIATRTPMTTSSEDKPAQAAVTVPAQATAPPTLVIPELIIKDDDSASLSSYATGREELDDDTETGIAPPTPPPAEEKPQPQNAAAVGSDVSRSTSSTADATPARRKSVRMSLPPTFSATPPALDDDEWEEQRGRRSPWASPTPKAGSSSGAGAGAWASRIRARDGSPDRWEDSSEEDDDGEYSTARRLLSRMGKSGF